MIRYWSSLLLLFSAVSVLQGQSHHGMGISQEIYDKVKRLDHKYSHNQKPQTLYNISGFQLKSLIDSIDSFDLSAKDTRDIDFLKKEYSSFFNQGSSIKKHKVYRNPAHFLSYQDSNAFIHIDPAIFFSYGRDAKRDETVFRNTRGFKIRGGIRDKVFFYTNLFETQANYLNHIVRRINRRDAIPGQGFYKRYESNVFGNISGWDYLNAEGAVTYVPSEFFSIKMGHGSVFLGSGYQSLLLSDYADGFFHIEMNTSIGIFNYKNVFAELAPIGSSIDQPGDPLAPKKYMATHYLTLSPSDKLKISLFESVIFGRKDHFEFQYLNPLILYRVIEQKLDSPDNVLLGLDVSYRLNNQVEVYGQTIIDEMRVGELFSGSGWWGNKIGYQIGVNIYDALGIDHLDGRVEYNVVRPYTYSHRRFSEEDPFVIGSYSHYNQELAHPLGANFREIITHWDYRISRKWNMSAKFMWANVGLGSFNYGSDILRPNETRVSDTNNAIGQGESTDITQVGYRLTYSPYMKWYVDLDLLYRNQNSSNELFDVKSTYFALSFRMNMSHSRLDY